MSKGMIFSIEEFAVHDGPGIRKTVFLKGCPLRCMWCHNPEGLSFHKEIMITTTYCLNCGKCKESCKEEKCTACGKCINICPRHLRRICGMEYEAKDLANELLKGKEILEKNNGGITISGGEPLAQPEFLIELVKELKPIHVAIETSGFAPENVFLEAINLVDLVLMDIKHTDLNVHNRVTGVDNLRILSNLRLLCVSGKPFYIRVPLIPGINDTEENMQQIAELIKDAKNLIRVELLPYNKIAGAKYKMVGKQYQPDFDVDRKVNIYHGPFQKHGIRSITL